MATSSSPAIPVTGIRGFLMWYKREQPAIFAKIEQELPTIASAAFSGYTARNRSMGKIYRSSFTRNQKPALGKLSGYYGAYGSYNSYASAPITVDYNSLLSTVNYQASPTVDYNAQLSTPVYTASPDPGTLQTVNTGAGSGSSIIAGASTTPVGIATTNPIGTLITAASAGLLTASQIAAQNSAVNANLAQASAGLTPNNTSLNSLGVPTVSSGDLSSGTLLALGAAAIVALVLLGDK